MFTLFYFCHFQVKIYLLGYLRQQRYIDELERAEDNVNYFRYKVKSPKFQLSPQYYKKITICGYHNWLVFIWFKSVILNLKLRRAIFHPMWAGVGQRPMRTIINNIKISHLSNNRHLDRLPYSGKFSLVQIFV